MFDLARASELLKILADPSRIRLLLLLQTEELTVAELAAVTLLAQPRVSTHLGRLKKVQLVRDRRSGVQNYYRMSPEADNALGPIWAALQAEMDDAVIETDRQRLHAVLAARARERGWADAVAGDMERHYSPGRTWEAMARATLQLLELGDVLDVASGDGVLAQLLARRARSVTCVDASETVVAAANRRLSSFPNTSAHVGDMHQLPFEDNRFCCVLLMHALTYTREPELVLREVARVGRPQGTVLVTTLNAHGHEGAVAPYDHANLGFAPATLATLADHAGIDVDYCDIVCTESRPPHFEVVICHGTIRS